MTVGTWKKPDRATQGGTEYKNNIESCIAVAERFARAFAPHEQSAPNMTVRIDPGFIWDGQAQTLMEIGAQSTPTITAPTNNPRIDRVILDPTDGTIGVVKGTEASNPIPPNIPSGKVPICRVYLTPGQTVITNEHITDERVFALSGGGGGGGGLTEFRLYQNPGSYQFTVPQDGIYYITLVGAGGGGGGGVTGVGGGGGGGGEALTTIRRLTAGTVFNITVGSGGSGGSGSNNGQPGGDTRVDYNLIAGGGAGGKRGEIGDGGRGGHSRTVTDWNSLAKVRGEDGWPGTASAGGRGGDPGNCAGLGGDGATASANATTGTVGGGGGGGYGSRSGARGGHGLVLIRW